MSLVYSDRRDSFNIECGHVMVIPAGVTAYLINRGNNEKLVIVKLINPVSNPGNFEVISFNFPSISKHIQNEHIF